jgi:GH43 family beta-xylosidase
MNLKIEIRRNSDGEIAVRREDRDEFSDFIWSEGNYSCDCNREIFFCLARDESETNEDCGESRYSVRITDDDTGAIQYDEFEKNNNG